MDINKTLAWKQSLIFFVGIILVVFGIFMMPFYKWIGLPISIVGYVLWIYNIKETYKSDQSKKVRIALIIPKLIFLIIAILGTLYMILNVFLG